LEARGDRSRVIAATNPRCRRAVQPKERASRRSNALISPGLTDCHNGEPLDLDQPCIHACPNYPVENLAKNIALTESPMTIDRERRVIGNFVLEIKATKPAIGEMEFDFLARLALGTDTIAITENEQQHEFWINRRSADFTVEGLQFAAKTSQYPDYDRIDPA
jgi:hypothetical protein